MKFKIKRKLLVTHLKHHTQTQPPYWTSSCSPNSRAKMVTSKYISCTTPITFSQKLYQSVSEVEESEKALEANSLERLKNLAGKVLVENLDGLAYLCR